MGVPRPRGPLAHNRLVDDLLNFIHLGNLWAHGNLGPQNSRNMEIQVQHRNTFENIFLSFLENQVEAGNLSSLKSQDKHIYRL